MQSEYKFLFRFNPSYEYLLAWEPDESASSCVICSGRYVWPPFHSDRCPAYLAQVAPITTVYLIWGGFDTMTEDTEERHWGIFVNNRDDCRWCGTVCGSAIATLLNTLDGIISPKEEKTTALKAGDARPFTAATKNQLFGACWVLLSVKA